MTGSKTKTGEDTSMPWNSKTLEAVKAGLRRSAADGDFVPGSWIKTMKDNADGGCQVSGCGWGLIAWFVAIYGDGSNFARRMLPVGCNQNAVNQVLMMAGLTSEEIDKMTPQFVWTRFDQELLLAYNQRHEDWNAFIQKSMVLAEGFISVLERVAVSDDVQFRHLPFLVHSEPNHPSLFPFMDEKSTTLVLSEDELV